MDKILIVDDVDLNRMILSDILEQDFEIEEAADGASALELLNDHHDQFAIVLLDLAMPGVTGFDVLEYMGQQQWLSALPVIVISGEDSLVVEERTLKLGASDFVHKPFEDAVVRRRVHNIVELNQYKQSLEDKVAEQTEELQRRYEQIVEQAKRIKLFNEKTIEVLGMTVEYRHTESGEHVHRVKAYTEILAREAARQHPDWGLTDEVIERIGTASVLHDLGKIAIPDSILLKPGKLTPEEYDAMKAHTTRGSELVLQIRGAWDDAFGKTCYDICRYHHERYDGRGYPEGLVGDAIPLAAQLVSIADVYDALVSPRVYKASFSYDKALEMIVNGECGVFSPALIECVKVVAPQFEETARSKADQAVLIRGRSGCSLGS